MAQRNEFRKYVRKFRELITSESLVDTVAIRNIIVIDDNPEKRETIIYKNGVIEENIIIPKTKSYYNDIIDIISDQQNIALKRPGTGLYAREIKNILNKQLRYDLSKEIFFQIQEMKKI